MFIVYAENVPKTKIKVRQYAPI